jgi:outer membrane lipoprotein SlyB
MSYRSPRHFNPAQARAARIQTHKQQLAMRLVGALVGLTLLTGGLLVALQAHAADSTVAQPATSASTVRLGTVESVQAVEVKGKGSGVGVVAGAVVGGLLGNQVGRGTGNALATVGGAAAGGYAGNEVEKHVKRHTLFKTSVKLDDGSVHTYTVGQQYAVGARVKVSGKKLSLAP